MSIIKQIPARINGFVPGGANFIVPVRYIRRDGKIVGAAIEFLNGFTVQTRFETGRWYVVDPDGWISLEFHGYSSRPDYYESLEQLLDCNLGLLDYLVELD